VQLIDDATAALAPAAAAAAAAAAPAAPADEDAEDAAPVSACVAGVDGRQVCIEMFPPQLLTRLGDSKKATLQPDEFPVDVQRKLNGVRAVAALEREAAEPLLYSRTRKVLAGHPQVRAELARFARAARGLTPARAAHPPVFVYLDGELYRHGQPLHAISGQARRADAAGEVEYHVYDAFFPHSDIVLWRDRRAFLEQLFARVAGDGGAPLQYVRLVETVPAADLAEVRALADRFVAEGYEGAVVRRPAFHYTYSYNNYHSANVLKVKPLYDAEFPVVGFKSGKAGKGADTLLWICRVPEPKNPADAEFTVAPKNLTLEESRRLYACLQQEVAPGVTRFDRDFRGRPLTVEYPELSAKTGKPTQAKATVFRTYEGGPERDPVRAALAECE
jgi:ATP-dependent DNA ligase